MKILYKFLSLAFVTKSERNRLYTTQFKGILHSDESESVHAQLYLQEDEFLFI